MPSGVDERLHMLGLAEYLQLSPPLVERLLHRSLLPGQEAAGLWNFDRVEVDRWLDLGMPGWHHDELHAVATTQRKTMPSLIAALQRGNVLLDLPVSDARQCLERVVTTLDLPPSVDRPNLLQRLVAREQLSSTAMDGGFAIPHTSRTGPRLVPRNVVAFVRTARPIAFGSPDGGLSDILFLVLASDQAAHLVLLARVANLCKFPLMGRALRVAATPGEVVDVLERAEQWLFARPRDEQR
jgi:mannitol/fructose-specific phosphotransferase system IIA component (Ntr-type)